MTKFFFLLLAALIPAAGQPDRFGIPACDAADLELADRTFYTLCHSSSKRVAMWTAHELKPGHIGGDAVRPRHFRQDSELNGAFARNADYRNSGFSRGHLVPAEDLAWSGESIGSTFLLSNAVPQRQKVNAGLWRRLEAAVRDIAAEADAAYVITGPVFATGQIEFVGEGRVAVPTHTFKVVLAVHGGERTMYAAIVPNADLDSASLEDFTVSAGEVERITRLDFFSALPDDEEQRLESQRRPFPVRDRTVSRGTAADSGDSLSNVRDWLSCPFPHPLPRG